MQIKIIIIIINRGILVIIIITYWNGEPAPRHTATTWPFSVPANKYIGSLVVVSEERFSILGLFPLFSSFWELWVRSVVTRRRRPSPKEKASV